MNEASFLSIASKLAQEAARGILNLYRGPLTQDQKKDHSLVTNADLVSDKILREGLHQAFPDHVILTEEHGFSGAASSDYIWLIDPLDGTRAFANGIPGFSVMVGLLKKGKPCLGVVVDPLEGFVYEAVSGGGAYLVKDGKKSRLRVSSRKDYSEMPLVTSTGFPKETLQKIVDQLHVPLCDPINSVGIKMGLLVRQKADIYINHHSVHYWDTCAPQIILEEAGGCFTRLDGKPLEYDLAGDFSHHSLTLASHGIRHTDLISQLSFVTQS